MERHPPCCFHAAPISCRSSSHSLALASTRSMERRALHALLSPTLDAKCSMLMCLTPACELPQSLPPPIAQPLSPAHAARCAPLTLHIAHRSGRTCQSERFQYGGVHACRRKRIVRRQQCNVALQRSNAKVTTVTRQHMPLAWCYWRQLCQPTAHSSIHCNGMAAHQSCAYVSARSAGRPLGVGQRPRTGAVGAAHNV